MAKFKESLKNQTITLTNCLIPTELKNTYVDTRKWDRRGLAIIICIGGLASIIWFMKACDKEPEPLAAKIQFACSTSKCHSRLANMTNYFKSRKNPHPEQMAEAVLATKSPRLLAAIAVAGEKNTPYTVRRGGYKQQHAGAWQVNEKYWPKVPETPVEQALHAERILEELTEHKSLKAALSYYGGDTTNAYQKRVLAEFTYVPK